MLPLLSAASFGAVAVLFRKLVDAVVIAAVSAAVVTSVTITSGDNIFRRHQNAVLLNVGFEVLVLVVLVVGVWSKRGVEGSVSQQLGGVREHRGGPAGRGGPGTAPFGAQCGGKACNKRTYIVKLT